MLLRPDFHTRIAMSRFFSHAPFAPSGKRWIIFRIFLLQNMIEKVLLKLGQSNYFLTISQSFMDNSFTEGSVTVPVTIYMFFKKLRPVWIIKTLYLCMLCYIYFLRTYYHYYLITTLVINNNNTNDVFIVILGNLFTLQSHRVTSVSGIDDNLCIIFIAWIMISMHEQLLS